MVGRHTELVFEFSTMVVDKIPISVTSQRFPRFFFSQSHVWSCDLFKYIIHIRGILFVRLVMEAVNGKLIYSTIVLSSGNVLMRNT